MSDYWTRFNQRHPYKRVTVRRASSYRPCNRQGCRHDLSEHKRARSDGAGIIVGACEHGECLCAQYVSDSLVTGNRLLDMYDRGLGARPV